MKYGFLNFYSLNKDISVTSLLLYHGICGSQKKRFYPIGISARYCCILQAPYTEYAGYKHSHSLFAVKTATRCPTRQGDTAFS